MYICSSLSAGTWTSRVSRRVRPARDMMVIPQRLGKSGVIYYPRVPLYCNLNYPSQSLCASPHILRHLVVFNRLGRKAATPSAQDKFNHRSILRVPFGHRGARRKSQREKVPSTIQDGGCQCQLRVATGRCSLRQGHNAHGRACFSSVGQRERMVDCPHHSPWPCRIRPV